MGPGADVWSVLVTHLILMRRKYVFENEQDIATNKMFLKLKSE